MIPNRWTGQNALFSINEYNGFLRVALTKKLWEAKNPDNLIFIFDQKLRKLGELIRLKTEEDIYAVRFVGERGYVVTFKRIDGIYRDKFIYGVLSDGIKVWTNDLSGINFTRF